MNFRYGGVYSEKENTVEGIEPTAYQTFEKI